MGARIGEICQAKKESGQRERETAPGSPIQDDPGLKEGSYRSEEQQGKPVGARERQGSSDSSLKKPYGIWKKIIGLRVAGLVPQDEPDDSPKTHKSVLKVLVSYEEVCTQEVRPGRRVR